MTSIDNASGIMWDFMLSRRSKWVLTRFIVFLVLFVISYNIMFIDVQDMTHLIETQQRVNETLNSANNSDHYTVHQTKKNKILIVSVRIGDALHYGGSDKQNEAKYKIISDNKQRYADKYDDIEYLELNEPIIAGLPPWQKPFFIQSILKNKTQFNEFEWILWMDADAAFINCDISLRQLINEEPITLKDVNQNNSNQTIDLIINGDKNAIVNNGIFAFRNSDWSLDFVNKWTYLISSQQFDATLDLFNNKWVDQSIFLAVLCGMDPTKYKYTKTEIQSYAKKGLQTTVTTQQIHSALNRLPSNIQNHIGMMPRELWNSYQWRYPQNKFIIHCAGSGKCKKSLHSIIWKYSSC